MSDKKCLTVANVVLLVIPKIAMNLSLGLEKACALLNSGVAITLEPMTTDSQKEKSPFWDKVVIIYWTGPWVELYCIILSEQSDKLPSNGNFLLTAWGFSLIILSTLSTFLNQESLSTSAGVYEILYGWSLVPLYFSIPTPLEIKVFQEGVLVPQT